MAAKIDQIIRTRRRSIAIIIDREGKLIVRAPLQATEKQIRDFVEQKSAWIQSKQALAAARSPAPAKKYVNGETFLFLGKAYPLAFVRRSPQPLVLNESFSLSMTFAAQAETIFTRWYQAQARRVLAERADWYARRMGVTYTKIRISSAETRWGSCSSRGTLSFTWRLVMAPLPVIDYVVVHELAHLVERNHGTKFWAQVQLILPDYRLQSQWLKSNGHLLRL
jgi:predicted metal-dependent hydrolase